MPYIPQDQRDVLDPVIKMLLDTFVDIGYTPGQLNYVMTRLAAGFIMNWPDPDGVRYFKINAVTGAIINMFLEYYIRFVQPYEKIAKEKNGDIPEYAAMDKMLQDYFIKILEDKAKDMPMSEGGC